MGMSRIIFWVGLICLVVFAIRSKIRGAQKRQEEKFREAQAQAQQRAGAVPPGPQGGTTYSPRTTAAAAAVADAETMLECAQCGVFFPASEVVRFEGRIYCSTAHAALPPA
jgi:uncharacterized protein